MANIDDLVALIESKRGVAPFVVAIEGFGGSGKSTLATHLATRLSDSAVVPMDDFILKEHILDDRNEKHFDLARIEREALIPFTQGLPFNYRRLDWQTNSLVPVDGMIDSTLVILEGICSYHPKLEPYVDVKVWVETPIDIATARGRARDAGNENEQHWDRWQATDLAYLGEYTPNVRADITIAGS
jgi:uridine kinase